MSLFRAYLEPIYGEAEIMCLYYLYPARQNKTTISICDTKKRRQQLFANFIGYSGFWRLAGAINSAN